MCSMHLAGPFQKSDGLPTLQWGLPRSRWQKLVARPFGWIEERQKPASYKSTDLPIQSCSQSHLCAYAGAHTREIFFPSVPKRTLETYPIRGDLCADFLWKARLATRAHSDNLRSTCCGNSKPQDAPGSRPLFWTLTWIVEELDEGIVTCPSGEAQMPVSRIITARRFARRPRGRQQLC